MKEPEKLKICKQVPEVLDQIKKIAEILETSNNSIDRIIDVIEFMQKVISMLIFISTLLVFRVFLWDFINFCLGMNRFWINLSEGYKILVLSIPATIVSTILSHFVKEKIKKYH